MIKGCALVGIMLILSGGMVGARLPEVGDVVQIYTDNGLNSLVYVGKVTDVSDEFIGLFCWHRYIEWPSKKTVQYVKLDNNVTIGSSSIRSIYWNNN